jgi:hypothetical protein
VPRAARAARERTAVRRRAVGTRDRITAHLALVAEISDRTGMASTRLAEAVGYPGSSVAFAQLLSGMERDGLIIREVRGKRTYRITLSASPAVRIGPSPAADRGAIPAEFGRAPDYDELADLVLIRLLRRLAELRPAELAALERLLVPGLPAAEEVSLLRAAEAAAQGLGHAEPDELPDELKVV